MGMFDRDVLYGGLRLDREVAIGDRREGKERIDGDNVVLLDAVIVTEEFPTDIGVATKSNLLIGRLDRTGTRIEGDLLEVNTLSGPIGEKVKLKSRGDLPAIVTFFMTDASKDGFNDALVMQGVRRYDGPVPKFEPLREGIPF